MLLKPGRMLANTQSRNSSAVREAANRARRLGRPVLASWTEPSSQEAISFFAQQAGASDRVLWLRPSSGEALVGVGTARTLTGSGIERFKQIASAWRELLADAVVDQATGHPCSGPLLVGGFSFDPGHHDASTLWSEFPDARLVLPSQTLLWRNGAAWLTHNVLVDPADGFESESQSTPEPEHAHRPPAADTSLSPEMWKTLVGSVARGIRSGQLDLEKVVLAHAEQVERAAPMDSQAALRKLAASYPSCTVFAIAHHQTCFLGATPERLIALENGTASTVALAGSVPRGATEVEDDQQAEYLLRSPKERAEHAIVVGALRDGLAQVCTRVVSPTPSRGSESWPMSSTC